MDNVLEVRDLRKKYARFELQDVALLYRRDALPDLWGTMVPARQLPSVPS